MKEFEDQIPDWKKGALENVARTQEIADLGYRNKFMGKLSTYFQRAIENDEEYEKMIQEMDKMKNSLKEIKHNVSDKLQSSDVEMVKKGFDIYEKTIKNMGSKTMDAIRKWDPEFDLLEFEREAQYIFEEVYAKFLEHDVEYLEGVCANEALGYFKSMINFHESTESVPKFKNIVFMKNFSMNTTTIHQESGTPLFQFTLEFAEINCFVSKFNPEEVVSGYDNNLEYVKFNFVLSPWESADVGRSP